MPNCKVKIFKKNLHLVVAVMLWASGCCTFHGNEDYENRILRDDAGVRYQLLERASINQMLDGKSEKAFSNQMIFDAIRERVQKDPKLVDELNSMAARFSKSADQTIDYFRAIKDEMRKTGGELYFYKLQIGKETERGLVIVLNGRVIKKYWDTRGVENDPG